MSRDQYEVSGGQRWSDIDGKLPDILIVGPATNKEGWAVTVSGIPTPTIMPTERIVTEYRLVEQYRRP